MRLARLARPASAPCSRVRAEGPGVRARASRVENWDEGEEGVCGCCCGGGGGCAEDEDPGGEFANFLGSGRRDARAHGRVWAGDASDEDEDEDSGSEAEPEGGKDGEGDEGADEEDAAEGLFDVDIEDDDGDGDDDVLDNLSPDDLDAEAGGPRTEGDAMGEDEDGDSVDLEVIRPPTARRVRNGQALSPKAVANASPHPASPTAAHAGAGGAERARAQGGAEAAAAAAAAAAAEEAAAAVDAAAAAEAAAAVAAGEAAAEEVVLERRGDG